MQIVVGAEGPPYRKKRGKGGATPILGIHERLGPPPIASEKMQMIVAIVRLEDCRHRPTLSCDLPFVKENRTKNPKRFRFGKTHPPAKNAGRVGQPLFWEFMKDRPAPQKAREKWGTRA